MENLPRHVRNDIVNLSVNGNPRMLMTMSGVNRETRNTIATRYQEVSDYVETTIIRFTPVRDKTVVAISLHAPFQFVNNGNVQLVFRQQRGGVCTDVQRADISKVTANVVVKQIDLDNFTNQLRRIISGSPVVEDNTLTWNSDNYDVYVEITRSMTTLDVTVKRPETMSVAMLQELSGILKCAGTDSIIYRPKILIWARGTYDAQNDSCIRIV